MKKIKDYFLIGSLHTTALVSNSGSIDWLCFPHFDSQSIFAKLLDEHGGSFEIDASEYSFTPDYIKETAIVENKFKKDDSEFILKDFMLPQEIEKCSNHFLIRKIQSVKGENQIKFKYNPMPDYAGKHAHIMPEKGKLVFYLNKDIVILHLPQDSSFKKIDTGWEISFKVKDNESKSLVLEYVVNDENSRTVNHNFEDETIKFWKKWINKGDYFDLDKTELERSMITLKLMQFYPTGALVAAPTTSLPADLGGVRNWDYRYVWIRDATFTIYAFHVLKCDDEALRFFSYLKRIAEQPDEKNFHINVMYTIWGDEAPKEKYLDYLSGYKNSSPVRIGNDATKQLQLDVYGSLIDAHYFMTSKSIKAVKRDRELLLKISKKIEEMWKEKGAGIWEIRGKKYNYTYSKVMAWVGIDRILRMKDEIGLNEQEIKNAEKVRKEIYNWIWENCYDPKKENLMQYAGAENIDATNLLFIPLQFLNKDDERTKTIIENTCKELCKNEVFIYRYLAEDGMEGKDKAFVLCSFWMISAYAILGEVDKAKNLFEKFKKYIGPAGLMSEQMDPDSGEYLGNYPQAFSHLGFVMSAHYIHEFSKKSKD